MSSQEQYVRVARNNGAHATIAITGAATGVGALLTRRLVDSPEIKEVLALDDQRGDVAEAQWHITDVRDPGIAERFRRDGDPVDAVVHLAVDLDLGTDPAARTAYNVRGAQTVLTAAAAAGVRRVVLCTSAMVYGALPENDVPLSEDAELSATADGTGISDLLEIEELARRAPRAHPGLNVTVLRPAMLVGGTDTALTRYFESPGCWSWPAPGRAGSSATWTIWRAPWSSPLWRRPRASWRWAARAGWSRRRSRSCPVCAGWSCPPRSRWVPPPGCTASG